MAWLIHASGVIESYRDNMDGCEGDSPLLDSGKRIIQMPMLRGRQTVSTFSILFASARRSLKAARESEEGSFYEILNCLVMGAFTVEAYMNHLGHIQYGSKFDKFEKSNVWAKYRQLRRSCSLPILGIPEAYPSVGQLLEFRNTMAHGRTENNLIAMEIADKTIPIAIGQSALGWRAFVTCEYAEEGMAAVEALINELHDAAGQGKYPFLTTISGLYSLATIDP